MSKVELPSIIPAYNEEEQIRVSKPRFSLIVPAFNEEARIGDTLRKWVSFLDGYYPQDYEIVVIMDGCTDKTVDVVSTFVGNGRRIVSLVYSKKLGKGGALVEAFKRSQGEVLFFTDADGSLPPKELPKFVKAIEMNDLVIGCRYYKGSLFMDNLPLKRLMSSRIFNTLIKLLFPKLNGIRDTQCGAKAVRKDSLWAIGDDLFISDFAFDVNLIYSVLRHGFSVSEVCVDYNHVESSSKVSYRILKTGLAMLLSLVRLRLVDSRFGRVLYDRHLNGLIVFLMKVVQ